MKLIRGIHNIKPCHQKCIISIGNFDGFHIGHKSLISNLKNEKLKYNSSIMLIIFEPQPQEYFLKKSAPLRLSRLRDKIKYFKYEKIDYILCIPFKKSFSLITGKDFIRNVLVKKLKIQCIIVGNDFKFGYKRYGNINLLKKLGNHYRFKVINISTQIQNCKKVSSTLIRKALYKDQISFATKLLGHQYCISGRVIHGKKFGRTIGFPTANISLKNKELPINGVYIVKVNGIFTYPLYGVANIGYRPTIYGNKKTLEVHLIDVSINIYGLYIDIVIIKKIRNEKKFNSIEDLTKQISNDILYIKDINLNINNTVTEK
ncbi:MAG: bifunctional riboflavin kinase/FAD synthetase [Enterobacterales bacterium]